MSKIKLTKKQKAGVERWLKKNHDEQEIYCPFYSFDDCKICKSWFPKIKEGSICPCPIYTRKRVILVANQMLKYKGEK